MTKRNQTLLPAALIALLCFLFGWQLLGQQMASGRDPVLHKRTAQVAPVQYEQHEDDDDERGGWQAPQYAQPAYQPPVQSSTS